jgi:hypothetical protein
MFKNKRQGVELTMNVLIIAVISLLVLMLLAFLLFKGFGNWSIGTGCETHDGKCIDITDSCSKYSNTPVVSGYSCKTGQKCCTAGFLDDATKPAGS